MYETIAQAVGYVGLVTSVLSFQFNKGKRFYSVQFIMKLCFVIHYVMLLGYSGAALNCVGLLNCLLYYCKSQGKGFAKKPFWVYIFAVIYGITGIITILSGDRWGIFITVASVATAFMLDAKSVRIVRYYQLFIVSPSWLIYNFTVNSHSGIVTEIINIVSVVVAFIRYRDYFKKHIVHCAAKINLVLSVPRVLDDGYHEISTVMQTVGLFDTITVRRDENIVVVSDRAPAGEDNICYKAAELFKDFGGAHIKIRKRIPMAAGLGGGSADAAGVMRALNALYGNPYSQKQLEDMAITLGSDVPFFIKGGTQLVEGRGEKLTVLPHFKAFLVLVKHGKKMSTGQMYGELDKNGFSDQKDKVHEFCEGISNHTAIDLAPLIFNDFEAVCDQGDIKRELKNNGAITACLSGSGPTVFGLFSDKSCAEKCADNLRNKYREVYVCETTAE